MVSRERIGSATDEICQYVELGQVEVTDMVKSSKNVEHELAVARFALRGGARKLEGRSGSANIHFSNGTQHEPWICAAPCHCPL